MRRMRTCNGLVVDAFQLLICTSIEQPLKVTLMILHLFQAPGDVCLMKDLHDTVKLPRAGASTCLNVQLASLVLLKVQHSTGDHFAPL